MIFLYVGGRSRKKLPGISPLPAPTVVVYHNFVKKYTRFCKWFFTEFRGKLLHLLVEFAIMAGIVWIIMAYHALKEAAVR